MDYSDALPLPLCRAEFDAWADSIIDTADLPDAAGLHFELEVLRNVEPDSPIGVFYQNQKYILARELKELDDDRSSEMCVSYFVNKLRLCAVKQLATEIVREMRE